MRIAILSGSIPTTTFIDALVNTMASEGLEMVVIGKRTGAYNYHKGVTTIEVPSGFNKRLLFIVQMLFRTGFKHFAKIVRASNSIKELYSDLLFYLPIIAAKPDKVHVQWAAFVHNRALLFELFPERVLVSLRGAHINYTPITTPEIKASYIQLLPKVHKFHAVCNAIVAEAKQYGVEADKTSVIYSCVSEELLQKEIKPKEDEGVLNIISVGRFFWKKGYEYALDALCQLKKSGVVFKYTIIADGATPTNIIYQIHQLGIKEHVSIINGLPHKEVLKEIETHDVLLLPSVEEGIANVVLEAMAIGALVVTTDAGGMTEAVVDNVNGFIVPVRDIGAISDALMKVSRMTVEERFAIVQEAKKTIREQHNKKDFTNKFVEFYKN